MEQNIMIYHGSEQILAYPVCGGGRRNNDFGPGLYCTEDIELAREWAVSSVRDGFVNRYALDMEYLNVLHLNSPEYTILNWIAVLVEHRLFSNSTPVTGRARKYLHEHFAVNVNAYDVVIGYRADDSYFDYAESFLNNSISVEQLARAMRLGRLGEQIVVRSEHAFSQLCYEGYESVSRSTYYIRRKARNDAANEQYYRLLEEDDDGLYIRDIMRGGIGNEDPRIPRNISG